MAERRIYVLPTELLVRIRRYQADEGLLSEAAAVRAFLNSVLQEPATRQEAPGADPR